MKKKVGKGTCYEDSFLIVLSHSESNGYPRLIHGTVYSFHFGKRIKHAWVELNHRSILDAASGHIFHHEQWKILAQPRRLHIYTLEQARDMVLLHGTYGPWEGYLGPFPSTYGYDKKEQARALKVMSRRRK